MNDLKPFLILLIVALILSYIPMEETLKKICLLVIGVIALIMLLNYSHIL